MILRTAKRLVVLVFGVTVILFGILLLFIPGPGTLFLFAGVGVLATEFVWARWLLHRVKHHAIRAGNAVGFRWGSRENTPEAEDIPRS